MDENICTFITDISHIRTSRNRIYLEDYNEELILAIAAMREGDEFHVGEYIVRKSPCVANDEKRILAGKPYKIKQLFSDAVVTCEDGTSWSTIQLKEDWRYWRKATVQEIINHFKKEENKMRIVGEELGKQQIPEATTFGVRGSSYLKTALVEEAGLKFDGPGALNYLTLRFDENSINGVHGSHRSDFAVMYFLPQDYQKALEHAKRLVNTKKEINIEIKGSNKNYNASIVKEGLLVDLKTISIESIEKVLNAGAKFALKYGWDLKIETVSVGCVKNIDRSQLESILSVWKENFGQ